MGMVRRWRERERGRQESVNPNKPFTRALRAARVPENGANDMPEIAGPEWNLSGILRRFRRIRNSEDRFCYSLPSSLSFSSFPSSLRFGSPISIVRPYPLSFAKRFQSWLHKEVVCGDKEAGEVLCERRFSLLSSLFLSLLSSPSFSVFPPLYLPFSLFLLTMRRCRLRFISANESFRDARRRFILE